MIVVTMYIDVSTVKTKSEKSYTRYLLRTSYRENGKVKKKTIANISHLSEQERNTLQYFLKNKDNLESINSLDSVKIKQGPVVGAVYVLKKIADRLGITEILGNTRIAILSLWLIFARLIDQGSRLSAVRLAKTHAVCEILKINNDFNENTLYKALDWCSKNQFKLEQNLFNIRYKKSQSPTLYLYDVTSSYLEGNKNFFADYGYNRDGKKGKKQIVVGLLTDNEGYPISVRVFNGNTNDTKTVFEQINTLKKRFNVKNITLVGDRGMLKKPQQDALNANDFHFITAITKAQIKKLIKEDIIQIELFDTELCEIELDNIRYILRRNPIRDQEIKINRKNMINNTVSLISKKNAYLLEHSKAKVETQLRIINQYLKKRKLDKFCVIGISERTLELEIDEEKLLEIEKLDGCYVLKTDLNKEQASAKEIHSRYKDLGFVESAFRTMKTAYLETRPVYVRKKSRTRGHIFIVMLSYMICKYLQNCWKDLNITIEEGIYQLSTVCAEILQVKNSIVVTIPEPRDEIKSLLAAINLELPESISIRQKQVATNTKLQTRRKS
jgi:transposase